MIRPPPRSTRTDTLFPYTTLFRSETKQQSVWLTELFVDDMDGQLRQIGIGDMIVGKHIGRMMSALGGRLSAYRSGLGAGESLEDALVRNLYRSEERRVGKECVSTCRFWLSRLH